MTLSSDLHRSLWRMRQQILASARGADLGASLITELSALGTTVSAAVEAEFELLLDAAGADAA